MGIVKASIIALAVAGASLGAALAPAPASAKDIVINMAAPDWLPTRFMQEEFDKTYKAKSGNNVKLVIDFIPWGSFYQRVAASLSSGEKKYQMIVTDSQWLGDFVEGGHYLKLNKYIDADPELQGIIADLHPVLLSTSSSYPYKSKNYYGFPQFPDNLVTGFRKDLFCNATERANFKKEFNETLPCYYNEWEDVDWKRYEDIGKFFQRKKGDKLGDGVADDDFYGIAYQAGKPYDFASMQVNGFIWQAGGDIWDETATKPALGVVNSDKAVSAFEHYLSLLKYMPPVAKTGQMDIFVVQDLYMQGKVAAIVDWVGVMGPVIDPKLSKVADKTGFAEPPGTRESDGSICSLVQHRRSAVRSDDVEQRRRGQGGTRHREMVAVEAGADQVRQERRPIRHAERDGRSGLCDLGAVQPRLSRQLPLAEGRLAHSRVLPVADRTAGANRQGDHRPGHRQAGPGYGRCVPGQASAGRRPHQIIADRREREPLGLTSERLLASPTGARVPGARFAPPGSAVSCK